MSWFVSENLQHFFAFLLFFQSKNRNFDTNFYCFYCKKPKPLRYGGKQALINEHELKLFCLGSLPLRRVFKDSHSGVKHESSTA
jgi:hypothetical protein